MTEQTKEYDGKIVTNTLAGISLQNTLFLNLPMTYKQKSTINEHLNIFRQLPTPEARPAAKYLCVGNGGHVMSIDDQLGTPIPIKREPTDVAPSSIIPLILRPVDDDIGDDIRVRYAGRRKEEHQGKLYWAWYFKRLDYRGVKSESYHTKVQEGKSTVQEFEYSDLNLYPKNTDMPDYNYEVTDTVVPTDGDYVHSTAGIKVVLDLFDIQELLNVAKVKYGDPRKAVISELCICSGVDFTATGESSVGSPFTYTEAIGVQAAIFLTTFVNVAFQNKAVSYLMDIGNTEPMAVAPGQFPQQVGPNNGELGTVV